MESQADAAAAPFLELDHHPVRVVDDAPREVLEDGSGHPHLDPVEVVNVLVMIDRVLARPRAHACASPE